MAEEAGKKKRNLSGLSLLENKIAMVEWTKNLLAIFVQIEVYVGVFIYLLCQGERTLLECLSIQFAEPTTEFVFFF